MTACPGGCGRNTGGALCPECGSRAAKAVVPREVELAIAAGVPPREAAVRHLHHKRDYASITHTTCGKTSYNRDDIVEGYCGNCHVYPPPEEYVRNWDAAVPAAADQLLPRDYGVPAGRSDGGELGPQHLPAEQADALAAAADVLGTPLYPWQRWLVIHALELLPEGGHDT